MSNIQEVKQLRKIIYNMLNFTNLYCIALDSELTIKFVNLSLTSDLGYGSYEELINKCWIDFVVDEDKDLITTVGAAVAKGIDNWEEKYREVTHDIIAKSGKVMRVHWFNSHVNSKFDWIFSFGIKKEPHIYESNAIRDMYYDLIKKDKIMIDAMRDELKLRDDIGKTCKPVLVEDRISIG